jgi:hypothetical protein
MLGLVDGDFSAAGEGEAGKFSPTLFTHIGDRHVFRFEVAQSRGKVVAHQEKFVPVIFFGIVERGLQRRHGEDQPTEASVHTGKLEHVAEKGSVGFGIPGVDDDVCAIDQAETPVLILPAIFSPRGRARNKVLANRRGPQGLKPAFLLPVSGTAEAVPFPKLFTRQASSLPELVSENRFTRWSGWVGRRVLEDSAHKKSRPLRGRL